MTWFCNKNRSCLDGGKEVYIVTTMNRLSPLLHYVYMCVHGCDVLCVTVALLHIVFMWAGLTCV